MQMNFSPQCIRHKPTISHQRGDRRGKLTIRNHQVAQRLIIERYQSSSAVGKKRGKKKLSTRHQYPCSLKDKLSLHAEPKETTRVNPFSLCLFPTQTSHLPHRQWLLYFAFYSPCFFLFFLLKLPPGFYWKAKAGLVNLKGIILKSSLFFSHFTKDLYYFHFIGRPIFFFSLSTD